MIPDNTAKQQAGSKGRNSPRASANYNDTGSNNGSVDGQKKANNYYSAIQGKGINMNGMQE